MSPKEIHMICSAKTDLHKSRKDLNQKEVIIDLICQSPYPNSIKEVQWFSHLEGVKFAEHVKALVIRQAFFIHVKLAKVLEK